MNGKGELDSQLAGLARVPVLLVASDYDGTIAPIVADPMLAKPHREAAVALRMLASLPQTHVAIVSGRSLRDLSGFMGSAVHELHLIGSHGSEFDLGFADSLPAEAADQLERIASELRAIAATGHGFFVERKPASVAFHYRNAQGDEAESAINAIMAGPATYEGVHTRHGKAVVELGVVSTNKGTAIESLRSRLGVSAVVFFGDDVTDEDAFATLTGPDLGVKVGEGRTRARHRVDGPRTVARALSRLAELRADWLAGGVAVPVERHSFLTDQRAMALVTPDARIVWLCMPRLDSPALFAELLGGPTAGYFAVESADGVAPSRQVYRDDSLVLETHWEGFSVTDCLDASGGRPTQRAGRSELIRLIQGTGRIRIDFSPRPDFGRTPISIVPRDDGLEVLGTLDPIVLRSAGVRWEIVNEERDQTARAELDIPPEGLCLELRYGTGTTRETSTPASSRTKLTQRFWSSWARQLKTPHVANRIVRHSALVLKGLCYGPTGAIAAAGTTSLPEHIGGVRNWDYRYCWLRDGAMAAASLVKLGSTSEAMQFLDWVLGVVEGCDSPERLRPLYDVTGRSLGPEAEISDLAGYRGSRPVRVGNDASRQVQLDVFGPIVDLVAHLMERDAPLSSEHWYLVKALVQAVEARWQEPDHGIWEIRKPPRHHVHSKVMCWLTVDRALRASNLFLDQERADWRRLRDQIAEDVLACGYRDEFGAFTAAYDGDDPDAAALWVGLSGLLPPSDERFRGTVKLVETSLLEAPTVFRYRGDDGLPGFEGGFHICASWLVDSYILLGRIDDARRLFDQLTRLPGPTGLLSEQYAPNPQLALGNVPQAYSHIGIIENALKLAALSG